MPTVPHAPINVSINAISAIIRCHIDIASSMRGHVFIPWNKSIVGDDEDASEPISKIVVALGFLLLPSIKT